MRAIGLVASRHHRSKRMRRERCAHIQLERGKGQERRAFEIARHQELAGRQCRSRDRLGARGLKIGLEQRRRALLHVLFCHRIGVQALHIGPPIGRKRSARRGQRRRQRLLRPALIGFFEKHQVKQPFAGVIDDIDWKLRPAPPPEARDAFVFERQAQFRDALRRLRPRPVVAAPTRPRQNIEVIFIGEARHGIVGLRL